MPTATDTDCSCHSDAVTIAAQNDLFRTSWPVHAVPGRFVMTQAIAARSGDFQRACLAAVRTYDERYEYGSPEPTDLEKTRRVLTILFPEDY